MYNVNNNTWAQGPIKENLNMHGIIRHSIYNDDLWAEQTFGDQLQWQQESTTSRI